MKALDEQDRVQNFNKHGDPPARCPVCGDDGWVVATKRIDTHNGRSDEVEEMAPCPFCVRGYRQEFPVIPTDKEKAKAWIKPPWGEDGWWQGRDLPDHLVEASMQRPSRPLSISQQKAELDRLVASVGLRSMEP